MMVITCNWIPTLRDWDMSHLRQQAGEQTENEMKMTNLQWEPACFTGMWAHSQHNVFDPKLPQMNF